MSDFCDVCGKQVGDVAKHKRRGRCFKKAPMSLKKKYGALVKR